MKKTIKEIKEIEKKIDNLHRTVIKNKKIISIIFKKLNKGGVNGNNA